MDSFMRDSDAFSWYMERDPSLRSTVVAIAWLDRSPDWETLCAKVERASRLVPLFRKRVLEPPARLSTPRWLVDHEFDLERHLDRVDARHPEGSQTAVDVAHHVVATDFDRRRPLWRLTLVEHLPEDRAALVMKLHHALTDGVGGMELALLLFDPERGAPPPADLPQAPSGERLGTVSLVRESLARDWARGVGFLADRARSSLPSARHGVSHPLSTAGDILETSRSILRTVAPVRRTLSPVMTARGLERRLDLLEVDLQDLKRASAKAGGTVNDAFLAAVTGGLYRYHERHGASVDRLRVTLPISIRREGDPIGGNRITLMRFVLPVSGAGPADRIPEIHRLCLRARRERSLEFTNTIAGALNLLPRVVVGNMLKHVDFLASDVPGFADPVYLAGALVERYVAFGPTIGAAMNLTLLSYNGRCGVGVTLDTAAVPDQALLMACLREGFEEVLALGGGHRPVALLLHDAPSADRPLDPLSYGG